MPPSMIWHSTDSSHPLPAAPSAPTPCRRIPESRAFFSRGGQVLPPQAPFGHQMVIAEVAAGGDGAEFLARDVDLAVADGDHALGVTISVVAGEDVEAGEILAVEGQDRVARGDLGQLAGEGRDVGGLVGGSRGGQASRDQDEGEGPGGAGVAGHGREGSERRPWRGDSGRPRVIRSASQHLEVRPLRFADGPDPGERGFILAGDRQDHPLPAFQAIGRDDPEPVVRHAIGRGQLDGRVALHEL